MNYDDEDDEDDDEDDDRTMFANPGSGSALRAASKKNPRIYECPSCKEPNRLTLEDIHKGYQCDSCADRAEGLGD